MGVNILTVAIVQKLAKVENFYKFDEWLKVFPTKLIYLNVSPMKTIINSSKFCSS